MEVVTLTVQKRDKAGSRVCESLRKEGYIPAVLYGHGEENVPLALPQKELELHLRSNVRILKLEFGGEGEQALIKDLQWDTFGFNERLEINAFLDSIDSLLFDHNHISPYFVVVQTKGLVNGSGPPETARDLPGLGRFGN